MIKPLLRTIPAFAGNVKLACTLLDYNKISNDTFETNIRGARILPLSSSLFQKSINANLLNSSWEYDLKKFYANYSDTFFDTIFPITQLEMPILDKTQIFKNRNTDLEYGVKRISYEKSNCQFACFAPIYIDNVNDIPAYFLLKLDISNRYTHIIKYIKINIGNNPTSNSNYIYKYLSKYLKNIDDNVAYMNNSDHTVTYYGIDLINGGFTKVIDSTVSSLFNIQMPIQMFDQTISKGFERNRICMRQSIPLSFYFNVQDILDAVELKQFQFGTIEFSGYYYDNNDNRIDWYDYDWDYDFHMENILSMNDQTGIMSVVPGYVENIMDVQFPAFTDTHLVQYQFSNKLSTSFSRWKLKYSSDEWPYITNMSWAFSNNQDSNYKYREYPTSYLHQTGYAHINDEFAYNLIFPFSVDREKYDMINPRSAVKYKAIMDNYCLNWFDIVYSSDINSIFDTINWADVNNGYTYFDSVLYNLNAIYNKMQYPDKVDKIDKFAMLLYPNTEQYIYEEDVIKNDIMFVSKTIEYAKSGVAPTVSVYSNIVDNVLSETDNYTLFKPTSSLNANIQFNQLFTEAEDDYTGTVYVNMHDLGIEYYDINAYAKVRDVFGNSEADDKLGVYTMSNWKYTTPADDKGNYSLDRNKVYTFKSKEFFGNIESITEILNDRNYIQRRFEFIKTLWRFFIDENRELTDDVLNDSAKLAAIFEQLKEAINDKIKDQFKLTDGSRGLFFLDIETNDYIDNNLDQFNDLINAFVCASFKDATGEIYLPEDIFNADLGFEAYEQLNVYNGLLLSENTTQINQHLVNYSVNCRYTAPGTWASDLKPAENVLPNKNDEKYYISLYTNLSPLYINSSNSSFDPKFLGSTPTVEPDINNKPELKIGPVVIPNTDDISQTYSNMLYSKDWFINCEKYNADYISLYDNIVALLEGNNNSVKYILDQDILTNFISVNYNTYNLNALYAASKNLTKALFVNMQLIYATIYNTLKEKILEIIQQKVDKTTDQTQLSKVYLYNPILNQNKNIVGRNVMLKKGLRFDECADDTIYADEFNEYSIDDNVLYMHPYNITNLLKLMDKYKNGFETRNDLLSVVKTAKLFGKVVDMTYLKKMSMHNASNDDTEFAHVSIPFKRTFYEQYKIFETDENGQMTVRYMYVDFKDLMRMEGEDQLDDTEALKRYINQVNVFDDNDNGVFCRVIPFTKTENGSDITTEYKIYFNIVEYTDYIKIDEELWQLSNIDNKTQSFSSFLNELHENYIDLFVYRPIKDIEFDEKYYKILRTSYIDDELTYYGQLISIDDNKITINTPLSETSVEYDTSDLSIVSKDANDVVKTKYIEYLKNIITYSGKLSLLEDTDTLLYPCFNTAYSQDREDTIFFKNYCLNNISKVKVYISEGNDVNVKNYYRYNENNASLFVNIIRDTENPEKDQYTRLKEYLSKYGVQLKLYKKLHESDMISFYTDNTVSTDNEFNNQYSKFNINIIKKDGITYGYYIINVDINNTADLFDIRGFVDTDENNKNIVDLDQIQNIKYITFINGINITTPEGKRYVQDIFKQLCPFLYINVLSVTSKIDTMMSPAAFNLTNTYTTKLLDPTNGSTDRQLVYIKQTITSAKKQILQRYTDAIVPYIKKCSVIPNQYNYKFKDMNVSIINTGKFNSIGDTVIYKENKNINTTSEYNIYGFTDDPNKQSYNNVIYTYKPLEHKDYNKSRFINLMVEFSVKASRPYAYNELIEAESDTRCKEIFKEYVSKLADFENDDQILFLYNKYRVSFKTSAIGVNFDNTQKMYTLEYKFNLL